MINDNRKNKKAIKKESIDLLDCYKALSKMQEVQINHLRVQAKLIYELYLKSTGQNDIPGILDMLNYEPVLDSKFC